MSCASTSTLTAAAPIQMCRDKLRSSTPVSLPRARLSVCKTVTACSHSTRDRLNVTQFQGKRWRGSCHCQRRHRISASVAVRSGNGGQGSPRSLRSEHTHHAQLEPGAERKSRERVLDRTGRHRPALLHFGFRYLGSDESVRRRRSAAPDSGFQPGLESGCRHPDARAVST